MQWEFKVLRFKGLGCSVWGSVSRNVLYGSLQTHTEAFHTVDDINPALP